ncbi:hypothetical protein UFOVP1328_7 [uncultured Caudovirales phage]|uniref:Uncharacterized protein n=1 Tax=uncultured Caudovirales phage TaxID=2100421 RepID=A0A6J5QJK3_9CAUD|nr:hypothetical protein UFOVP1084_9 [uncultured Caudovirales phage]CAB4198968.1 hypothetical protein UFOVP1328_7 [uncultured Caudovirales phage]CAB5228393.1 hypothetical protein UFOVP1532_38 [uncultured Caudovirales phage]
MSDGNNKETDDLKESELFEVVITQDLYASLLAQIAATRYLLIAETETASGEHAEILGRLIKAGDTTVAELKYAGRAAIVKTVMFNA